MQTTDVQRFGKVAPSTPPSLRVIDFRTGNEAKKRWSKAVGLR